MSHSEEHSFLMDVLRGDAAAVAMCEQLFRISQVLDDLIDGDKPVSPEQIIYAFWQSLIELPANPFYRQHDTVIRPLMASALQDWIDATRMERCGDAHGKHLAFVLRDQLTGLVVQVAGLIGGYGWMQSVSERIRRYFHDELLSAYLSDIHKPEAV